MPEDAPPNDALLARLAALLGPRGLIVDAADVAPYGENWRRAYCAAPLAVARPADTREVAAVVRACAEAGVGVVPQGGNTSLADGAVPSRPGRELVLSLARLNRVRDIDAVDLSMTVEAGVPLKAAQEAAEAADCLLPLSIASEGSAQIGGVLATNAGGNNTVRWGNARDLVLGLEAVLPDGAIWNGLRRLRKDNTGYCLRQLLVGSEGTLGIITAAVLKLAPRPRERAVAFCAVASAEAALELFRRLRDWDPAAINAYEYMTGLCVDLVLRHIPGTRLPLSAPAAHYVLIDLATPREDASLATALEGLLEPAIAEGLVDDVVIAQSEAQIADFWHLREEQGESQRRAGAVTHNDVSVPVSKVPELLARAIPAVEAQMTGIRVVPFGHLGDGNIHFNLVAPEGMAAEAFLAQEHTLSDTVTAVVRDLGGSFSAEHGVGLLKRYMMEDWRGGTELAAMRAIKAAIDPSGIMNPGKLLP